MHTLLSLRCCSGLLRSVAASAPQGIRGNDHGGWYSFPSTLKWRRSFVYRLLMDHTFACMNTHEHHREHFLSCLLAEVRQLCLLVTLWLNLKCRRFHNCVGCTGRCLGGGNSSIRFSVPSAPSVRRERDAEGVEGWGMGREYPPPQPIRGSGGVS